MASVTVLGTATFNTTSGTKTVTATPTFGDLIVIVTAHTGNTSSATPTDNNASSPGAYSEISACAAVKASSADQMRVFIRNNIIFNASSTVFSHAPGTSSGGGLVVWAISGLKRTGTNAARQGAIQSNIASGTPTPVLGSAALTSNSLISMVFNATNPGTTTIRASWTDQGALGYATPTTGAHAMSRNSGETATSIAWGGASPSAFCSMVLELDCSIEIPSEVTMLPMMPPLRMMR